MSSRFLFPVLHLSAAIMLTSCGGGSGGGSNQEPSQFKSLLKPVLSEQEFLAGLESAYTSDDALQNRDDGGAAPVAASGSGGEAAFDSSSGGSTSSQYSTTYTQEVDVDEVDVVKYDGSHLYIAPSLQNNCCYLFADDTAVPATGAGGEGSVSDGSTSGGDGAQPEVEQPVPPPAAIRILATNVAEATASEIATIELAEDEYVQGLYLLPEEQALLTVGTRNFYGSYGGYWLDIWAWRQENLRINYYDISDPAAPVNDWEVELEGGFVDSRRVGDTVYLVSRHTPNIDGLYYYPVSEDEINANRNTFKSLSSEDIIPVLTIRGPEGEQSRLLFAPEDCLVTNEAVVDNDKAGYPTLTSITAISMADPLNPQTVCYNESAAGLYMSSNALYLSDVRYSDTNSHTRIHKFALGSGKPQYRGSADVEGYLWNGGQNDFRISEHQGMLRLMTTSWKNDDTDRQDHILTILKESDDGESLTTVSSLPNSSRPQEIGKPNEGLYGVRFVGDRAYVVTFEQIDPLYVLDLSNAEDPFIAGSLEIPGFSDFLHPIGENLLLGLGMSSQWNGKVKLELFDVSDASAPVSRGATLIGDADSWTSTEAQYNRHAFTYLAGDSVDRLAVPVQRSGNTAEGGYFNEEALYLFEITNKATAAAASLDEAGSILASWPDNPSWYGGYRHRSVIDGDAVYFISGDQVWSALWDTPDAVTGPQ